MAFNKNPSAITAILMVAILIAGLPGIAAEEDPSTSEKIQDRIPTRTVVDESENNNKWSEADQLPSSTGSFELHGNVTNSDVDLFYIDLDGGNGPLVDRLTIDKLYVDSNYMYDIIFVIIYAFYPDDNLQSSTLDENFLTLRYWDQDGYFTAGPAIADASYSGIYGVGIQAQNISYSGAIVSGTVSYNLSVSITTETPVDSNNDEENPVMLSLPHSDTMDQNQDMMEWFKIDAPHSIHPTELDLTISFINPTPNDNGRNPDYGIQTDIYLRYNSRSSPGTFTEEIISISPNPTFQKAGLKAAPYNLKLNKNCTEINIGLVMSNFGLDSKSPNLNNKQYTNKNANTGYSITGTISADIPNNRPVLKNAVVTPVKGRSMDMFNFSVTYFDANNHTPEQIWLYKDGKAFRELSPINGSGQDQTTGVDYGISLPGSLLGKDKSHTMNFSAYDGEDWATVSPSGLKKMTVIVDDNLPPSSVVGESYTIPMEEDQPTTQIDLMPLFSDKDPLTEFRFSLLAPSGEWFPTYSDENITAVVTRTTQDGPEVLKVTPKENRHGTFVVTVNATDSGSFAKSAYLDLIFEVSGINDPPRILKVGGKQVRDSTTLLTFDIDQGEPLALDILAEDEDETDILFFDWDLEEVLNDPVPGSNFMINNTSGEMWVIPGDEDVPELELTVMVDDGMGGKASVDLLITVEDVNDPPVLSVPDLRTTIEGESLYITPSVFDPDLDNPGTTEQLIFNYNAGTLTTIAPQNAINFDPLSGRLIINALTESMNGEWEINITVSDLELGSDWGICRIIIENVNDAPVPGIINPEIEEGNLTVRFLTGEASDEEDDDLTYIWDFGDGSPSVQGVDLRMVEHTYPDEGSYTATLTVSDGESESEEETYFITVSGPPPDPDQDDDSMDDSWERKYGLDPTDPSDADLDPDNDGLTNREEYSYSNVGWDLNPRNPDTDEDGWNDGEEVDSSNDPMDSGNHPEEKYKDLPMMLYIVALLIMFLAVVFALLFFVMRGRNKPKAVAAPVMPVYDPSSYQTMPPGQEQYQAIPPASLEALPPAGQVDATGQFDQGIAYDQVQDSLQQVPSMDQPTDQEQVGGWQEPPGESELPSNDQGVQGIPEYQPPVLEGLPEDPTPSPIFEAPSPMDIPEDTSTGVPDVAGGNGVPGSEPAEVTQGSTVQAESVDVDRPASGIPPPPSIPDDL